MAIAACKEEKGSAFESRQQKTLVKESLNEGYCDVSGADGAFQQIGLQISRTSKPATALTNLHRSSQQVQHLGLKRYCWVILYT
jgi:hypothetical protein